MADPSTPPVGDDPDPSGNPDPGPSDPSSPDDMVKYSSFKKVLTEKVRLDLDGEVSGERNDAFFLRCSM